MHSVRIAHPEEGTNAVCFRIANETSEDQQYYLQDMNIQSFLRNIDWTTNCFSWIEAREMKNPSLYYAVDNPDQVPTMATYVYVFCMLRLAPGTYPNVEKVIETINTRLIANITLPESTSSTTKTTIRDLPCALYDIKAKYDTIADYKITGFKVGLEATVNNFAYTDRGYVPTSKVAPAILDMDLYPIDRIGTNNSSVVVTPNPRPQPVVYYDLVSSYSLDYTGVEENKARYRSDITTLSDIQNSLNRHSIDFASGVTNHLGLTPFRLPLDCLFSIDGNPIVCFDNGSDYMEYLIDPDKLDIETLSGYYVNAIGSDQGINTRDNGNSVGWAMPVANTNTASNNSTLFKISDNGLDNIDTLHTVKERVIVNNELKPSYLLLREIQIVADTTTEEADYKNMINILLTNIISNETPIRYVDSGNDGNITYTVDIKTPEHMITLTIYFTGGSEYIKENICATIIDTPVNNPDSATDITHHITGMRIIGVYDPSHALLSISELPGDSTFAVVSRLDATSVIPVLATYTSNSWLANNTGIDISMDSKIVDLPGTNITTHAVNIPTPTELTVGNDKIDVSQYHFAVNSTDTGEFVENTKISYHYSFTPAVSFTIPATKYDVSKDHLPLVNTSIAQIGEVERGYPMGTNIHWHRTGKITKVIAPHDHERSADITRAYFTFKHSLEIMPLDRMIAIYDSTNPKGHRLYRAIEIQLCNYKYMNNAFKFVTRLTHSDYCSGAHSIEVQTDITYNNGVSNMHVATWAGGHGKDGCSHKLCDTDTTFSVSLGTKGVTALNNAYKDASVTLKGAGYIYTYIVYVPYKEDANGYYIYDSVTDNDATIKIPSHEYTCLYNDMGNKLKRLFDDATVNGLLATLASKFTIIYPLGPYDLDQHTTLPEGATSTGDLTATNSDIHESTWFNDQTGYGILNNDTSNEKFRSICSLRTGQALPSVTTVSNLTKGFTSINIGDLSNHDLVFSTSSGANGTYKISLKRENSAASNTCLLPVSNLFGKSCMTGESSLVLETLQAFAYASIPSYDAAADELAARERGIIERAADDIALDIGSVIINGKVYLMDRNNLFAEDVNPVKYYPFFAFSNKLYVYMMSAENIDQVIESQLPHLRIIRTALAEIDIPTKYTTTTTINTGTSVVTFKTADDASIPIRSSNTENNNAITLNADLNNIQLVPQSSENKPYELSNPLPIKISSNDINLGVTVGAPLNSSEEQPTGDKVPSIMSGKISLSELTLSQLNGKANVLSDNDKTNYISGVLVADIANAGSIQDTVSDTVKSILESATISGTIADNIAISGLSDNATLQSKGAPFTGDINLPTGRGSIEQVMDRDGGLDMQLQISDATINTLITATEFEPLISMEDLTSGTFEEPDNLVEYGRGTIDIRTISVDVTSKIPGTAISNINASMVPPNYIPSTGFTITGTQYVPQSIDFSNVIGTIEDGENIEIKESHQLVYEVEIKPYNIPINRTISVPSKSSKIVYITGNIHRYPIWESTHTLVYKVV